MDNLEKSLKPVASFIIENTGTVAKKLCLIPGHFITASVVARLLDTTAPAKLDTQISYADPSAIKAAGYDCDQVADDFSLSSMAVDGSGSQYAIKVTPKSQRTRYRDFLNFIKTSGLKVSRMRFTDLSSNPSHDIFNSEIEVSKSSIGAKAGSDFLQLTSYINPANYLQNFVDVDLGQRNLMLDETTLVFLEIPPKAHFSIDFSLSMA